MSETKRTYAARIILDSISEEGVRLTTIEGVFPRCILSEFNTHRRFSRNSASSRAIPVSKIIRETVADPFIPERVGVNKSGMQAGEYYTPGSAEYSQFLETYLEARDHAALAVTSLLVGRGATSELRSEYASTGNLDLEILDNVLNGYTQRLKERSLSPQDLNVHKQHANRLLEPYMWHTVIVTANDFWNFIALRNHEDADPAIEGFASKLEEAWLGSTPGLVRTGAWHLPLVQPDEMEAAQANPDKWKKISSGRCARASYMTHNGVRDISKDLDLHDRLSPSGHVSPFEHPAKAGAKDLQSGNFVGWEQYRKTIEHESNYAEIRYPERLLSI